MYKWPLKVTLAPSRICDLATFLAKMPMQVTTKGDPGPIQDLWFSRHKLYHQLYLSIKAINVFPWNRWVKKIWISVHIVHNEKGFLYKSFPCKKYKFLDNIFIMRWYISAVFDMIYSALWFQIFLLYWELYILLESCE